MADARRLSRRVASSARSLVTPTRLVLVVFTVLVATVYVVSPVIQSADGRLVVYEAQSILHDGNTDLHEFGAAVDGFPCYRSNGHIISRYPYGTALVTAPLLLVVETAGKLVGSDPTAHLQAQIPRGLEKTLASLIAALACLALVLLGIEVTGRLAPSLLVGVLFAFGSAMWSTASRGLWQHGPQILLVTVGVIFLVRARRRADWRWSAASGLPLAAGYVVRPTTSIPIVLVAVYLAFTDRKAALGYLAAVAVILVPSFAYSDHIYGQVLNPYYYNTSFFSLTPHPTFLTALAGTMVSPARGLLVYSPVVLLALAGVAVTRRRLTGLQWVAIATILGVWVTASNTVDWVGGFSYGPRLLMDCFPWLALLMLPAADALTRPVETRSTVRTASLALLTLAFAWSFFVNARGAFSWSTALWNLQPVPAVVSTTPGRFWDWSDAAFFRFGHHTLKDAYPTDATPAVTAANACLS